uniref:U6 small nuclear RNA (adenine-(43)-N(6))-methyltransferase n=1 Tax=Rhabditophanes sp. KR3021 TaxID=114890 RepID=A0AC35TV99_9BILA
MHPKNIYSSNKPDFDKLATKYAKLRHFCTLNKKGKFTVDFNSNECVGALTEALLKENFDLEVVFSSNNLIPRLSNRLDYLLTIDDVIEANLVDKNVSIAGVDIGTGAYVIYPLLGSKLLKWSFVGTETDQKSIEYGKIIINNNKLDHLISIVHNESSDTIFNCTEQLIPENKFVFSMCNPPFFTDDEVTAKFNRFYSETFVNKWTETSRDDPRSTTIATISELSTKGGEVEFVGNMIKESLDLSNKINLFTSLVGKKSSIALLLPKLKEINHKVYEIIQGKTMRWIIMWSFDEKFEFPDIQQGSTKRKIQSKKTNNLKRLKTT